MPFEDFGRGGEVTTRLLPGFNNYLQCVSGAGVTLTGAPALFFGAPPNPRAMDVALGDPSNSLAADLAQRPGGQRLA